MWYDNVRETEEWRAFDNFMVVLRALDVLSNEQYQSFDDRKFIEFLLGELKDKYSYRFHLDPHKRKKSETKW